MHPAIYIYSKIDNSEIVFGETAKWVRFSCGFLLPPLLISQLLELPAYLIPALLSPWTCRIFYSPSLLFLKVSTFPSFSDNPNPHLLLLPTSAGCRSQPFPLFLVCFLSHSPASGPSVFLPSSLPHTLTLLSMEAGHRLLPFTMCSV